MFFADKRVVTLLSGLLGKPFSKKKKAPVPLDLKHNNWKEQVEKACSSALLSLGTGTCCVVKVARVSMEQNEMWRMWWRRLMGFRRLSRGSGVV